jgi:hypothetical protein
MNVGFTGTRRRPTDFQERRLLELLFYLVDKEKADVLHHGDCVGSDALAHLLAVRAGFRHIVIHPPTITMHRAYADRLATPPLGTTVETVKPYLTRNHDIVDASQVMIAVPRGDELPRSGTWATVRYARQRETDLYILYPFRVVVEQGDWRPSEPIAGKEGRVR